MNTLRSLILLLVVSALASASQAHSATAIDGYQEQANSQHSLLPSQEHEGDEPEGVLSWQACSASGVATVNLIPVSAAVIVANYSDFHPRAPPRSL